MKFRVVIPPAVEAMIAKLSPELKRRIRFALEVIQEDPYEGKALRDDLAGFRSYRVSRYRIIYRIHYGKIEIQIIDIALRSIVYERVVTLIRSMQKD